MVYFTEVGIKDTLVSERRANSSIVNMVNLKNLWLSKMSICIGGSGVPVGEPSWSYNSRSHHHIGDSGIKYNIERKWQTE